MIPAEAFTFSFFPDIENFAGSLSIHTFFSTPYRSTDKPHCERNHELIRYVFPKGKSLNNLTQDLVNEVFSNINSYVRKGKGDKTPYDLMKRRFGQSFLDIIGIRRIPNKKVKLTQLIWPNNDRQERHFHRRNTPLHSVSHIDTTVAFLAPWLCIKAPFFVKLWQGYCNTI